MKVTANVLLNYIRCRRYASLNDPDSLSLPDQFSEASTYYDELRQLFMDLAFDDSQDLVINHQLSYDFHPNIELFENYDFLIEGDNEDRIYCLVPSTSKDFLKIKFKSGTHNYQMFVKNDEGVYVFNSLKHGDETSNYNEKIRKLTKRSDDEGRIAYRYAFKRYLYEIINPNRQVKIFFVFLNSDYIFDGKKYDMNMFMSFDFDMLYKIMKDKIEADIYRMINHIELNDFTACPLVKNECRKDMEFECKFINFCFSHIPKKNSILDLFNSHYGFDEPSPEGDIHHDTYDLINEGYVDILDLPVSWLKNEAHLMQRYCTESDFIHIHKVKVEAMLKTLKYPLIYLDFEALPCVLPRYHGESPFSQSVFQYSIHIEKTEGKLDLNDKNHFEFIARPEYDNRRELVESMIKICNRYDSSIVVYHKTFEEQRLKEFQRIFPEHHDDLQNMIDRLFDLKDVVKNNKKFYKQHGFSDYEADRYNFYSKKLSGSYSLKKVVKVFNPLAYDNLEIKNGVEAYNAFVRMQNQSPTERDITAKNLLEYCKQDTYSMHEIIVGLKQYLSDDFHVR